RGRPGRRSHRPEPAAGHPLLRPVGDGEGIDGDAPGGRRLAAWRRRGGRDPRRGGDPDTLALRRPVARPGLLRPPVPRHRAEPPSPLGADPVSDYAVSLLVRIGVEAFVALSAYLLLVIGRVSFGQQAFFVIGGGGPRVGPGRSLPPPPWCAIGGG